MDTRSKIIEARADVIMYDHNSGHPTSKDCPFRAWESELRTPKPKKLFTKFDAFITYAIVAVPVIVIILLFIGVM